MSLRLDLAGLLPAIPARELPAFAAFHQRYAPHWDAIGERLYDRLPSEDQARFLVWMLKRWARIDLINPVERGLYAGVVERARSEPREDVIVAGRPYKLRDFGWQGQDFQLASYDWMLGIHDVYYAQYEHGGIGPQRGDVIIDAGAFIGDTAVLFHHQLGGDCQLHSFELLDENLALLQHNLARNQVPDEHIVLNKLALTEQSGKEITIDGGPSQGATSIFGRSAAADTAQTVQTVALDDYVVLLQLPRVDFIKMDIEGAELMALRGAQATIRHFRPRLAICLYHRWDDVFTLPEAILATGVDYEFRFKWVQLNDGWEAVLLARPIEASTASRVAPRAPATAAEKAAEQAVDAALTALARGLRPATAVATAA